MFMSMKMLDDRISLMQPLNIHGKEVMFWTSMPHTLVQVFKLMMVLTVCQHCSTILELK